MKFEKPDYNELSKAIKDNAGLNYSCEALGAMKTGVGLMSDLVGRETRN